MRIELLREDLAAAADAGLLPPDRVAPLWDFLSRRVAEDGHVRVSPSGTAAFVARLGPVGKLSLVHVLWFGGAILVLGAMSFFATLGFDAFGGSGLALIAAVYGGLFTAAGAMLWRRPDMKVMGGLCITVAVGMMPLATYGLQRALGLFTGADPSNFEGFTRWVKGGWFIMEVNTVAAAAFAMWRVRFPFLVVVPSIALWFMSMDIATLVFNHPSMNERAQVSVAFGVCMLVVGELLRRWRAGDLAFWLETFGLIALQGGLMTQSSEALWPKLVFVAIQIVLLQRARAWNRFFPIVVAAIGLFGLFQDRGWRTDDNVLLGTVAAAMLFAFGFAVRRKGPAAVATVAFVFVIVFGLMLPFGELDDDAIGRVAYCALALATMGLGLAARSPVLVGGGGLSVAVLLGDLAVDEFRNSMVFPIVIASVGIGVMLLGYWVQKHRSTLDARLDARLPAFLRALRVPPA